MEGRERGRVERRARRSKNMRGILLGKNGGLAGNVGSFQKSQFSSSLEDQDGAGPSRRPRPLTQAPPPEEAPDGRTGQQI